MKIATDPFEKLLLGLSFATVEATEEDRRFFTQRFLETVGRNPEWWVEELYVHMAALLGTVDLVPALAHLVARPGENSKKRVRMKAIAAIKTITGWDPELDERGQPRSVEETEAAVVADCTVDQGDGLAAQAVP